MDADFIPKLRELAEKYNAAQDLQVELEDGAVKIRCDKGCFRFYYDFSMKLPEDGYTAVPLYHWQAQPKYIQLKGLLDRKMVTPALAMRIHHLVSRGEFTRSLKDILVFETELFQFITGQRVDKVFADFSGDVYTNCIMSTEGNVKASMELGLLPNGSEPVLLHELVCRNGVASDLPVDIQTVQYPIYVFKGKETRKYNEIDFELYGMENTQADCIRFILSVLKEPERVKTLQESFSHIENVYQAAKKASAALCYTSVEACI